MAVQVELYTDHCLSADDLSHTPHDVHFATLVTLRQHRAMQHEKDDLDRLSALRAMRIT